MLMYVRLHITSECELTLNQGIKILSSVNDVLTEYINNDIDNDSNSNLVEPIIGSVEHGSIIINLLIKAAINFSTEILSYVLKSRLSKKLKSTNFDIRIKKIDDNCNIDIHIENKHNN